MPLKSNLLVFAAGVLPAIDQGCAETAGQVKDTRDSLVHVITGALKASGRIVQVALGWWEVREGEGLPDARGPIEEFGSAKRPAHPHMIPAAERHRPDLAKNVGEHLKDLAGKCRV